MRRIALFDSVGGDDSRVVFLAIKELRFERMENRRSSLRGTMVQDLIDSGALVGRTRSDVERLFGPPDYRERFWYDYRVITEMSFLGVSA